MKIKKQGILGYSFEFLGCMVSILSQEQNDWLWMTIGWSFIFLGVIIIYRGIEDSDRLKYAEVKAKTWYTYYQSIFEQSEIYRKEIESYRKEMAIIASILKNVETSNSSNLSVDYQRELFMLQMIHSASMEENKKLKAENLMLRQMLDIPPFNEDYQKFWYN